MQCRNKIRNLKEAYKIAKEKKQTEVSPVFSTHAEARRFWDIEISWKFRSSKKLELIIEKAKQTTTMNSLHLMKKRKIGKLEKIWRNKHGFSSYFISKFSCANLPSYVSFFPHVWFSRQMPTYFPFERYFLFCNIRCDPRYTSVYLFEIPENIYHYNNVCTLFLNFLKLLIVLFIVLKPDPELDSGSEEKRTLGKIEPQRLKMLSFFLSSMKDNAELIHFHVKSRGPFRANNVWKLHPKFLFWKQWNWYKKGDCQFASLICMERFYMFTFSCFHFK